MGNWIQTLMRDHKEADSIAEESIRNYKTVTALGAESSMEKKYVSLVGVLADFLSLDREVQEDVAESVVPSWNVERTEQYLKQSLSFLVLFICDNSYL